MLVEASGRDALVSLSNPASPITKTVQNTPIPLRKIASLATVPAAAVAGFVMTPSRRIIAAGVGSAIMGVVGGVGKSKLDVETELAAKPALAKVLLDHYGLFGDSELAKEVEQIKVDYGVTNEEDFMDIGTDIYKSYLIAMVKNPYGKTKEIGELNQLKSVLGLDNLAVGQAHAEASMELYRTTCAWTPEEELEDPEHPDRMSLDKLLFLSERAFRQNGETEEAFTYEFSRVAKGMNTDSATAAERVADFCEPFYVRALASTRTKLDDGVVDSDMLRRARATLGIGERVSDDLHLSTYAEEVKQLLGVDKEGVDPSTTKFPDGAIERLDRLRQVLEISQKDADYELSVEVTPLYQATASEVFKQAASEDSETKPDVAKLWQDLQSRRSELCLSAENALPLLDSVVIQTLGTPLEEASTFVGVNNESGAYAALLKAIRVKTAVTALLQQAGDGEATSIDKFYDSDSDNACFGFLALDMRKKLYQMFLSRAIREGTDNTSDVIISDELEATLGEVKASLGITDDVVEDVTSLACGPMVESAFQSAAAEVTSEDDECTDELVQALKAKNDDLVSSLKVPDTLAMKYSTTVYKEYLRYVSQSSPSGIPSPELAKRLTNLQTIFSLTEADYNPMHLATFGQSYKKSVLESMGATGIILPEYRAPLEQLRDRLGVSVEDGKKLFLDAVKEKLIPMVKRVESEIERTLLTKEQLSQKRGRDMGQDVFKSGRDANGDLGIGTQGNLMGDIMVIVDFYNENDIAITDEETGEITYPVTAVGAGAVEEEMAEAMYRQFVVGGFTAQGKQAERYEGAAAQFGGILGMSKEGMENVSGSIGGMVYENFIENALQKKDSLDQQDMMFLANIQQKLDLTEEQGTKMMIEAQKKVLNKQAEFLFDSPTVSGAMVKSFREKCNSMGLELMSDLGIGKGRVTGLFITEVQEGIENGRLTTESQEDLTDIQESIGLAPEDCEAALLKMVETRAYEDVEKIDKELMRAREDNCVYYIKDLIKFAAFVGDDLGLKVKESRANKIVSMFEAIDFGDEDSEVIASQKELLKISLGL